MSITRKNTRPGAAFVLGRPGSQGGGTTFSRILCGRGWTTLWCAAGALVCLGLGGGCPGSTGHGESGAQCSDGKDNDGDGLVDCRDRDCADVPICGSPADGGPPDQQVQDDGTPADHAVPLPEGGPEDADVLPDQVPDPDQEPVATAFGDTCQNILGTCPDGVSVCVPSVLSTGVGWCSRVCQSSADCPPLASNQKTACGLHVEGSLDTFCLFVCRAGGVSFPCPSGFSCVISRTTGTGVCFP